MQPPSAIIWRTSHIPGKPGPHIPGITNICAGRASDHALPYAITDISPHGERLSNEYYSEMSAMWRVWKHGPKSDIVGWCQYRRYFWFGPNPVIYNGLFAGLDLSTLNLFKENFIPQNLPNLANSKTFTVGQGMRVGSNVYDMYVACHHKQDYLDYLKIVSQDYPHLMPFMIDQFSSDLLYGCDMFISTWEIFDEICSIWFPSLDKFIAGRTRIHEDDYQNRAPSFLSERVFTAWVQWKKSQGWQVEELPLMFVVDI